MLVRCVQICLAYKPSTIIFYVTSTFTRVHGSYLRKSEDRVVRQTKIWLELYLKQHALDTTERNKYH